MDSKFLPIGSVCTLKGRTGKVMIIGLYSVLWENKIKVYDYKGCSYPEGTTLSNQLFSFNHEDIEKIEFKGYVNSDYDKLLETLKEKLSDNTISNVQSNAGFPKFSNFVFDENGYVIKADSSTSSNPFINNVPVDAEETEQENNIFRDIKFDENGVVVAAGESTKAPEESSKESSNYEFDENGVVVAAGESTKAPEESSKASSNYEFDENGVVVAAGESTKAPEEGSKASSNYEFDENGVVVAAGESTKAPEENSKAGSNYEFDENGVVVATGNSKPNDEEAVDSKPDKNTTNSEAEIVDDAKDVEYEFDENGVIIGIKS